MEKTTETVKIMAEKLFQDCIFDPAYMSEKYVKERFEFALSLFSEADWNWIVSKYQEELKC